MDIKELFISREPLTERQCWYLSMRAMGKKPTMFKWRMALVKKMMLKHKIRLTNIFKN